MRRCLVVEVRYGEASVEDGEPVAGAQGEGERQAVVDVTVGAGPPFAAALAEAALLQGTPIWAWDPDVGAWEASVCGLRARAWGGLQRMIRGWGQRGSEDGTRWKRFGIGLNP